MIVGAHSFPVTGDGEHNFSTICAAAERAAEVGAELLLFPECALTGYPPRDIPSSSAVDFPRLAEMHAALHKLSDAWNLALIVGSMVPAENGVRNAVMIFRPGEEPLIYANAIAPYPGAPTMLCDASGRILVENPPDAPHLLLFDLSKHEPDFGERGRIELSDSLVR